MAIPKVDPSVRHISLGQLRRLTPENLASTTYVVDEAAVVVPMPVFLEMQKAAEEAERGGIQ